MVLPSLILKRVIVERFSLLPAVEDTLVDTGLERSWGWEKNLWPTQWGKNTPALCNFCKQNWFFQISFDHHHPNWIFLVILFISVTSLYLWKFLLLTPLSPQTIALENGFPLLPRKIYTFYLLSIIDNLYLSIIYTFILIF